MAVLHTEGLVHGFLVLRTLEGNTIADRDVTQVAKGDRVTNHLVFRFKDDSIYEETVVFSQRNKFRVASDPSASRMTGPPSTGHTQNILGEQFGSALVSIRQI